MEQLKILFNAVLELEKHPEAKDCIGYVNGFLSHISNDDILKGCSISWDDANKGYLMVWDDILPKYIFKADMLVCEDYYHYNFIIRDSDGYYLGSDGTYNRIYNKPFWRDIIGHLSEVYEK